MKYTVKELGDKFRTLIGDSSQDVPDKFIIEGINQCFTQLPMVPKLGKLFSKHYHSNLDANGHYKWSLNRDFRRIIDMPMLNFYTSTGGEPCKLNLCPRDNESFFTRNGLVELKEKGTPCEYTIEQEGDDIYLVVDRPSDVPIILDYIVYGFPKPVKTMEDEIEVSAIAENLILSILKETFYYESMDGAFAGQVMDKLDNKQILEAEHALYKTWHSQGPIILGEH